MAPKPKGEEPPPPPPEEVKEDPKIALRKQIEAQERDIFHLKHLLEALVDGEGHSLRDAKILELFKKNRELNLAYERERNSSSKLKFQVGQLQQEVLKRRNKLYKGNAETLQKTNAEVPEQTNPEVSQQTNPADGVKNAQQQDEQKKSEQPKGQQGEQQGTVEESIQESKAEIATPEEPWKEKFDQVALKLAEAQSVHTGLTMEVSKLRYALQREVGEHIPVAKVLEEGGEWKGRSQQISLLKDKVRELKAKLHRSESEEFQRFQIEAFHAARRKEFEKLAIEFLALREDLACQQRKLEGMIARRNYLENEIRSAKEKMAVLVRKSENDDRLITALRLEVESYRQITGPVQLGSKVGGPIQLDLLHKEHKLAAAFSDLKKKCHQQELEIQAQAELISYLRAVASAPFEKEVTSNSPRSSEPVKV